MVKDVLIILLECGLLRFGMKKKELFLSRDNFGEKPLYYYLCDDGFFFGSEIKFIKSLCKKNFEIIKN
jgi:asparagine synthetase B (glutamine-hydrolysing)